MVSASHPASGLREADVIRCPLSEEKDDEFTIIVFLLDSMPKNWTFKSQLRLRRYCRPDGKEHGRFLFVQNQFYPQTKEALANFTKNYLD
jgi:hypothetical protein